MIRILCGPMMYRPVHGTTNVYVKIDEREQGLKFEIRMGFTFPGSQDWCKHECQNGGNPFDEDYFDSYVVGKGYFRLKVAYNEFKRQMKELAESYWI